MGLRRLGAGDQTAEHALADGRGGITTRITALHVLGYLWAGVSGPGLSCSATPGPGRAHGRAAALLAGPWGLAETALLRGDHDTAADLSDRGRAASARVGDAAYLFPFLLTGLQARLAQGEVDGAERWLDGVARELDARAIRTLVAVEHGRGVLALATGDLDAARAALEAAAGR